MQGRRQQGLRQGWGGKEEHLRKTVTARLTSQVKGRTLIADKFVSKSCETLNWTRRIEEERAGADRVGYA